MYLSIWISSIIVVNAFNFVITDINHPFDNDNVHDTDNDNYVYDHNAILGNTDSNIYNKMTPEESRSKFSELIDRMDVNHNGMVEFQELRDWIQNVMDGMFKDNVQQQWTRYNPALVEKLDFDTYASQAFAEKKSEDHLNLMKQEKRRWAVADLDKDILLNQTEFFRFLHPENFKDMKSLLAQETLEGMDENNDSVVDINEYLSDMFPKGREAKEEWIRNERQNFGLDRDLNKDGVMDRDEIQNWLLPESYNRVDAEAQHLMDLADVDRNNILSKSEMLDKYKVFVGSQNPTDYENQYQNHDDL